MDNNRTYQDTKRVAYKLVLIVPKETLYYNFIEINTELR